MIPARPLILAILVCLHTKESGEAEEFEGERENRLMLRAQFAAAKSVVVQVEAPFYLWREHRGSAGAVDDTAHGLGDLQVTGRYELLRTGGFVPKHVLAVTGTLKLPTGASDRLDGDPHLQLGSGSWDSVLGLWYTYGAQPFTWDAGGAARLNTRNAQGFRYGHVVTGTLGVRRAFLDQRLFLSLEAQARNAGYDTFQSGARDPDSGGLLAYGAQSEHPVAFAGLSWDFAL